MAKKNASPEYLIRQLDDLQQEAAELEHKFTAEIIKADPAFRKSAQNLLHYLALRQHDVRELQRELATLGLSSLGRTESHVLASLQAVRKQLSLQTKAPVTKKIPALTFSQSLELLQEHTKTLLGEKPAKRSTRILVTLSTELSTDYELLCRMIQAGMNCARINCAHDDEKTWLQMIKNVRRAEKELGISCPVLMDLMGPKLRTGPLQPGPPLMAIQPVRDEQGRVISPASVWLATAQEKSPFPVDAHLPLEGNLVKKLQPGDNVHFLDTRGRKRIFTVIEKMENGVHAHLFKTSYLATGTRLHLNKKGLKKSFADVGVLPPIEIPILLKKDDFLILRKDPIPGEPAVYQADGHISRLAHISCTLPAVFTRVIPGQPILFDDGKIEGEIMEASEEQLVVKITGASETGSKLRADKGINLPDSELNITELEPKDKQDLAFVIKHADIVNLSFVNHPDTVIALQEELKKKKAEHIGIMIKIETKEGFRNLPHLLLAAMRGKAAGIMIARGDLAVECGWQRLAEVQEEILWLCEAAHMPVVWATQVLETLAKKGRPSRAEITDAAMSQRADCVMLNKGPHVVQAIVMLDNILKMMQEHQHKKTSMLRSLQVSDLDGI